MGTAEPAHAGGARSRRTGRWLRRTTAGLVVVVLAAAVASYYLDLGPRFLGWDYQPVEQPAQVEPPQGLTLPPMHRAPPVAARTPPRDADPADVRRALARLARAKRLGPHVAVAVDELSDGKAVFRYGAREVIPASTTKLLTTVAALAVLGPGHRFRTTVTTGAGPHRVVLVGGGDPLLTRAPRDTYPDRADLRTLATSTARELEATGRTRVRLGYDTSLFRGPAVNPHWGPSYVPDDVVSPVTPLWVDEGRQRAGYARRVEDPAGFAAGLFAHDLERQGITVTGSPQRTRSPAGADRLASVDSAPLSQIVQHVVEVSDNEGAEVLARQVALARGDPGSFTAGARDVAKVLAGLGVDMSGDRILGGSGLSRGDRLTTTTLLSVLETAASPHHPRLRATPANLPVAGFTGSLSYRFTTGDDDGRGRVRAKTGTLTGVSGLAGLVTGREGTVMAFVAVADHVKPANTLAVRAKLDQIAAALAGCACAAGP